jgi:two-component sensor histidine kinase
MMVVKEAVSRIHSMSLVHRMLYRSKNLSSINFKTYINDLIESIKYSYLNNNKSIIFETQLVDFPLLIDTAIPCGLVLNELIVNSILYAFPDDRDGVITINTLHDKEGFVKIDVADNGIGLPPDFDLDSGSGLGLTIVKNIVEKQMKGSIEYQSKNGLTFNISFKDSLYEPRV